MVSGLCLTFCFYFILFTYATELDATSISVKTNVGELLGRRTLVWVDGGNRTVLEFLGIPYAESTAGHQRFRKPVPKAAFTKPFNASTKPPSCDASSPSFMEDCLYLNVYVPETKGNVTLFPVMIWIHGGGFQSGTSSTYNAGVLSIYGDVIVVTINYRLGIFGFLRTANDEFPGNQGLWDQHMAIKWVHDNIRSFGGDPDHVTLFGESAGSKSVIYQSLYARNKGFFKRIIAESGSALSQRAILSHSNGENVIDATGCLKSSLDVYSCLRSKSSESLHHVKGNFLPVVDGDFVIQHPYDIVYGNSTESQAARDYFASLDMIAGVNMFDGALLLFEYARLLHQKQLHLNISREEFVDVIVPWVVDDTFGDIDNMTKGVLKDLMVFEYTDWSNPNSTQSIISNVINMTSDFTYFKSTVQTINGHSTLQKASTYFYEFAVNPSHHLISISRAFIRGPNHADEIPFVFGQPVSKYSYRGQFTPEEKEVSKAMMTLWTNFAKTGNPNTPVDVTQYFNTTWPAYDTTSRYYLQIGNRLSRDSVCQRFYPRRMNFWLEVVPSILQGSYHNELPQFQPSVGLVG